MVADESIKIKLLPVVFGMFDLSAFYNKNLRKCFIAMIDKVWGSDRHYA